MKDIRGTIATQDDVFHVFTFSVFNLSVFRNALVSRYDYLKSTSTWLALE